MTGTLLAGYILIPAIGIRAIVSAGGDAECAGWTRRIVALSRSPSIRRMQSCRSAICHLAIDQSVSNSADLRLLWLVVAVSGFASLGLGDRLVPLDAAVRRRHDGSLHRDADDGARRHCVGGMLAALILRSPRDRVGDAWHRAGARPASPRSGSMSFLLWTVAHGWKTMELWRAVVIAILPPSLCMGIGFPLALGMAARSGDAIDRGELARRIGRLYSLNVAGAILGSLVGGFPAAAESRQRERADRARRDVRGVGPVVLVARRGCRRWGAAVVIATAFFLVARDLPDPFKVAIDRRYGNLLLEFWRDEGAQTAVSVRASQFQHVLYLDGLHQANDQPAMVTLHRAIGHLPMVLHGAPKEALVVGMGGGATPGAVSQHPARRVQIVELSDSVRKAAPLLRARQLRPAQPAQRQRPHRRWPQLPGADQSALRRHHRRHHPARSRRRRPRLLEGVLHAGPQRAQRRRRRAAVDRPCGRRVEYTLIMRTFLDVFPHATLWYDANFMVGTLKPLVDRSRGARRHAAASRDARGARCRRPHRLRGAAQLVHRRPRRDARVRRRRSAVDGRSPAGGISPLAATARRATPAQRVVAQGRREPLHRGASPINR